MKKLPFSYCLNAVLILCCEVVTAGLAGLALVEKCGWDKVILAMTLVLFFQNIEIQMDIGLNGRQGSLQDAGGISDE